tara:strand:+ start:5176 stop:5496 length:321 start_codon:yes stop_codon:yes gene_type:complete
MDAITISLALSLHLGSSNNYNETHPHIRYNNNNTIAGMYYNSESRISTYVGKRYESGEIGFEIGAVTGYDYAAIVPYARATYKNLFIAPLIETDNVGAVIGFELFF